MSIAAPLNSAAIPITPVSVAFAAAIPLLELDVAPAITELEIVVAAVCPDVNGAVDTLEAPLNARTVEVRFRAADVLLGFSTLSIN